MIGKLIKHDLLSGFRRMGNIYLAAAIAAVAMLISAFFKNGILRFVTSAAVIIITLAALIVTFVSVVFGVNKSLFGREGYLTQTLPVRTSSLIFSKWITSSFWVVISYAVAAVSVVALVMYWTTEDQEGAQAYDMIYSLLQSFGLGAEKIYIKYLAVSAIIGLFNACVLVMLIIFAITLSNVRPFHKLGTVGVILYAAAVIFIIQGAAYGLESLCDVTLIIAEEGVSMSVNLAAINEASANGALTVGLTGVYFKTIASVFIYILTVQLTESKINLK